MDFDDMTPDMLGDDMTPDMLGDDMTPDMLGIALGLGEEIAMAERAGKMTEQEAKSGSVLGPPVSERSLIPISKQDYKLVNLADMNNWIIPGTKRLRSPFIEKWRRVALGLKDPDAVLLTFEEGIAYSMAAAEPITDKDNEKIKKTTANVQELKKLNLQLKLRSIFKQIRERRYPHGKNQNDGKEGI